MAINFIILPKKGKPYVEKANNPNIHINKDGLNKIYLHMCDDYVFNDLEKYGFFEDGETKILPEYMSSINAMNDFEVWFLLTPSKRGDFCIQKKCAKHYYEVVGFIITRNVKDYVFITQTYIMPGFRGKGYGKKMVGTMLKTKAIEGFSGAFLEILNTNFDALCFWNDIIADYEEVCYYTSDFYLKYYPDIECENTFLKMLKFREKDEEKEDP